MHTIKGRSHMYTGQIESEEPLGSNFPPSTFTWVTWVREFKLGSLACEASTFPAEPTLTQAHY